MSLLTLRDVTVRRGASTPLERATLSLDAGEFVGLLGPNGAGKTSLLLAALGLLPSTGAIMLGGEPLKSLPLRERARRVAFLPQEREVGWPLPVRALVALGRAPHRAPGAPLNDVDRQAVRDAMASMDVTSFADRPSTELSGGERARVLIARALAQETPLLLVDEPTAGLDPAHQIALMKHLRDLATAGRGILASLHDLGLAAMFCDRLIVLQSARIVADAAPGAVLTEEMLARVYGVRARAQRDDDGRLFIMPYALTTTRDRSEA